MADVVADLESRHAGDLLLMRANALQRLAAARLRGIDPMSSYSAALNGLLGPIETASDYVRSHLDAGTHSPQTVIDELDKLAHAINDLPLPMVLEGGLDVPSSVAAAHSAAEATTRQMRTITDEVIANVGEVQRDVASMRSTELEVLRSELSDTKSELNAVRGQIAAAVGEMSGEFSRTQQTRADEFNVSLGKHETMWTKLLGEIEERENTNEARREAAIEQTLEDFRSSGRLVYDELTSLRSKADALVGAIGRNGLTAGYVEWEKAETKAADEYRVNTIKFGIAAAAALIGLLAVHLLWGADNDFDPTLSVAGAALPAAFGALATYSAKESSRHRSNQVLARRVSLELASFSPFLAELPIEEQQELIAMFAPVFFGQAGAIPPSGPEGFRPISQEMFDKMLSRLSSRLRKDGT